MSQLEKNLTNKVAVVVGETIDRELKIAAVVLPASSVALIHMQIAAAIALHAIGNTVGNRRDDVPPETMYDMLAGIVTSIIEKGKPEVLRTLADAQAKEAAR